jgi:tripartite-type tricarboxylate transporter receptor subunit TctC
MMPLTSALAIGHIKSGKLRALAVTTAKRSSALPDVPTVAEAANLPDYDVGTWFGVVTQAQVPEAIVRKLSADISEIMQMPEVKTKLEVLGLDSNPQGPAEFDAFVAREFTKWSRVIKQAGIVPQ